MRGSIFERVGGFARVRRMVSDFYDKVLESPGLAPYFADVSLARVIDHQTRFFAALMGGPASFSDEQLRRAHFRLQIRSSDFDEVAGLFRETLEDHGLSDTDVRRLVAQMESVREHIVSSDAAEVG